MAFGGLGLYEVQMSSTSPELTTDGSFRKCWKKEDGEIATKCKAFTNEEVSFVPFRKLVDRSITLEELLAFFDNLECREQFQRMLVLDAVTFNVDRHLGNIGILVDNVSQKSLGIAPNFDFNLSMLPYVTGEEFEQIGTKLLDYGPAIGSDFTRVGQKMLTSEIRKDLINLQDFRFSFRGNKDFDPSRVRILETMINKQIQAILRGEVLYTRDVFVPKEVMQEINVYDNNHHLKTAAALVAKLKKTDYFSSVMEEIREDNHVCVIATWHEKEEFINMIIHIDNMKISCDRNGMETSIEEVCAEYEIFSKIYASVRRIADQLPETVKGR